MPKGLAGNIAEIESIAAKPVQPYNSSLDTVNTLTRAGINFSRNVMAEQAKTYQSAVSYIEHADLGKDETAKRLGLLNSENRLNLLINPGVRSVSRVAQDNLAQLDQKTLDLADRLAERTTSDNLKAALRTTNSLEDWRALKDSETGKLKQSSRTGSLSGSFTADMMSLDETADLTFKVSRLNAPAKIQGFLNAAANNYISANPDPTYQSFSALLSGLDKDLATAQNKNEMLSSLANSVLNVHGSVDMVTQVTDAYPGLFTPEQKNAVLAKAKTRDQTMVTTSPAADSIEYYVTDQNALGLGVPLEKSLIRGFDARANNEFLLENPMHMTAPEKLMMWSQTMPGAEKYSSLVYNIADRFAEDFAKDAPAAIKARQIILAEVADISKLYIPKYNADENILMGLPALQASVDSRLSTVGWVKNKYYAIDRERGIGTKSINNIFSEGEKEAIKELYTSLPADKKWMLAQAIGSSFTNYNKTLNIVENRFDVYNALASVTGDRVSAGFYAISQGLPEASALAFSRYVEQELNENSKSRRSVLESIVQEWIAGAMKADGYISADFTGTRTNETYIKFATGLEIARAGLLTVDLEKKTLLSPKSASLRQILDVYDPSAGRWGGKELGSGTLILPLGGIKKLSNALKAKQYTLRDQYGGVTQMSLTRAAREGKVKLIPLPHSMTEFYVNHARTLDDIAANNYVPYYEADGINRMIVKINE